MGVLSESLEEVKIQLEKSKDVINDKLTQIFVQPYDELDIYTLPEAINAIQINNCYDTTAQPQQILDGETVYCNGVKVIGTMPDIGAINITINPTQTYNIPEGYHNGLGTIGITTPGTITSATVLQGETGWCNGIQVTGNVPNNGTITETITPDNIFTLPQGYYTGGTVSCVSNATAGILHILEGQTAWVNNVKITGTMKNNSVGEFETTYYPYENGKIKLKIPEPGFYTEASCVYITEEKLAILIGLTPDNIREGVEILGITGTCIPKTFS